MAQKAGKPNEPEPRFFPTPAAFRRWFDKNHDATSELWVGFHKKGSGKPSITWPESVDQALCFGWIDGIRKSIDDDSYKIRFTPRKAGSIWSAVNLRRAEELIELGLMQPAGSAAFGLRTVEKSKVYAFEQGNVALSAAQEEEFRAHPAAWAFFQAQPRGYRKTALWWVISAKQEATRGRRLATLIADSEAGLRIGQLRR